MSIAWLNIEANEVVALLNSLGLLLDIDTGIYCTCESVLGVFGQPEPGGYFVLFQNAESWG